MDRKAAILAFAMLAGVILFGIGLLGAGFGEDRAKPLIDMQEAARIVLERFPNARIKEIELETEEGTPVYEVELVTADGRKKELSINAMTGKVEKIKHD